jgi:hypothetical protein
MRDIVSNIGVVQTVAPAVHSITSTSNLIDLLGFQSAAVIINTGAIAGDGNFTAKLQESDTDQTGDFADVAAADLIGSFPASLEAQSVVKVGYIGNKRYLRTVLTKNSGTSIAAAVLVVKGHAHERPVA